MCNIIANILHACLKGINVGVWLEIILENSYFHLSKIMDRMGIGLVVSLFCVPL